MRPSGEETCREIGVMPLASYGYQRLTPTVFEHGSDSPSVCNFETSDLILSQRNFEDYHGQE
jgi:hypothetical protein